MKKRRLSILLSIVMLFSLLPTTALAADYNEVKVNGVSLGDGEYLTSNAATAASISSTEPTTYVAWYKNGVLTLNNFTGKSNSGIVLQGAPAAALIIKLIGNNTITPYDTGIQGNSGAGSITITADSGSNGNLTINVTNSTRPVFGINGSANSVTISGSAAVTINAVATATNQESYGIKSNKAVSILDSASVNITCKTPNSTGRSDSCNGIFSDVGGGVTINTDGTIQIDVHDAGDEAYSYGINSMNTLTLTKVGGMTVKWKKASMQGAPISPSTASFDPTAYDTNETTATDVDGTTYYITTYRPKGAAPADNYPENVRVYNGSGTITSLSDGQCLVTNDGKATSYSGGAYVARYDSGTLYLNGYHGVVTDGMIYAGGDLNIEVEGDSSFTTSLSSATNKLYGIQADGKLNISGTGKLTVTANGNGNVYGIYANEGVTISAPLVVNVGKPDSSKKGPVHGIYTQSGAISLSGGDKAITATGGSENVYGVYNKAQTSSSAADNGNIDISGKLTVNLSNGSYNRGISSEGGVITLNAATVNIPGSYYYGIFNKNGNVDIKNNSDVDISSNISDNNGICTYSGGDLTIENSAVKVSAHGYAANLEYGKLLIENSDVELTKTSDTTALVVNTSNSATNTIDLSGSGTVTLTASGNQSGSSMIGGTVSITTPGTELEKGTYYGSSQNYDGAYDADSNKTVLKFMSTAPTATVDNVNIAGEKDSPIANQEVTITLTNDQFKEIAANTDVNGWFTNLPAGLEAKIKTDVSANGTTATVEISGTPSAISSDALAITIPAESLASNANLTVTSNENAKFKITTPITETLVSVTNLTGKTYNESAQEPTFSSGLTRGTDYTVSYAVKPSSTGTLDSDNKPVGAGTYVVTVAGRGSYTGSFTKDFEIGKATPVYTAPTVKTGLAYTGSPLELITKGSVSKGGEMQYKLDSGSYSTTIPTATNAGDYTVYFKIDENENYNAVAEAQVGTGAINITPANQNAPTGLGVKAPTASDGNGKITGTTTAMEYSTDSGFASSYDCSATATSVAPGTYYVRYKADANHNAGAAETVTVPDYSATKYAVTVTSDANGTASADMTSAVAGETVTLTATPNSGYVFAQWTDKTPTSLTIGADGKFTMPDSNVSVKATFTKTSGGGSSSGGGGGGYVPTTQKPEIKAAAGGKAELSKDGTTLTITADAGKVIDKVLLNGKDMGAVSELKGLKTGDKVEVIFKDQVTEPTKEELDKAAKEAAGELVLPARSAKLKNGSVKVVVKADLKAITDAGYTVKYKFYRSTKKSAGYKAMKTGKSGIYINTYGKKGTMYYYKARVMIYDKNGNFVAQTALKQCKYANRLWTK